MTGGTGEGDRMVNHTLRFWLGAALAIPGYLLFFVEGLLWIGHGALRSALLSLMGIAMLACGMTLLRHKRSV
ncbi:hypothetical protein [Deinococcus altitudinis]|uniref:hypothetical protein n=1 Tax=Deinococcus altitudinis TaxID=468914 RepID=UPI003892C54F